MFLLRSGCGPLSVPMRACLAPLRVVVLSAAVVALAGCSQHSTQTAAHDPRVSAPPYHVSPDAGRKPDLEDDGREAQIPPMKKVQPEPDDPREPWSRNYGRAQPVQRADAADPATAAGWGPVVRGPVPADLPPDFRRRLASAVDD